MIEEWRDIKGYEGFYQVSNFGRIKSLDYYDDKGQFHSSRIKSIRIDDKSYCRVDLYKHKVSHTYFVHRLVAEAFIPNLDNKPQINHIDENPRNNLVSNLEWVTSKENANHGTRIQRCVKHRDLMVVGTNIKKAFIKSGKAYHIEQYDLNMNYIATYNSVRDAAKANNVSSTGIMDSIRERNGIAERMGYIWKHVDICSSLT